MSEAAVAWAAASYAPGLPRGRVSTSRLYVKRNPKMIDRGASWIELSTRYRQFIQFHVEYRKKTNVAAGATGVMREVRLDTNTLLTGLIFAGLWLFPFGVLVYKSRFLPRLLGIWLVVGCFAWLVAVTGLLRARVSEQGLHDGPTFHLRRGGDHVLAFDQGREREKTSPRNRCGLRQLAVKFKSYVGLSSIAWAMLQRR